MSRDGSGSPADPADGSPPPASSAVDRLPSAGRLRALVAGDDDELDSAGDRGLDVAGLAPWLVLLAVEGALVVAYFGLSGAEATRLGYVLAPFVWINAGLWAVRRVGVPVAGGSRRRRLLAGAAAAGYVLLLLVVTGLVGPYDGGTTVWVDVGLASPGWGPVVRYRGTLLYATLVPYRVLGYLALGVLLYATLLDAAGAALSGVVGLASCVSCGFSVVLSVVAGVTGGSAAAAAGALYPVSVEVSTAAYLLAVVLLTWRPGSGGS